MYKEFACYHLYFYIYCITSPIYAISLVIALLFIDEILILVHLRGIVTYSYEHRNFVLYNYSLICTCQQQP